MNYTTNDLARYIYDYLNEKGANLGNASIFLIQEILDNNLFKLKNKKQEK